MITPRNAQSLTLGAGKLTGAVARTHNGTAQVDTLLQDLSITSVDAAGANAQATVINAIRVAGQRLDCSNQAMDANAFNPQTRQTEGTASISLPIAAQQVFSIDLTTAAAGDVTGVSVNVDPLMGPVLPINELAANALSFCAGLGTANIIAGAGGVGNVQLQATILRPVTLGRIGLTAVINAASPADINGLTVTSITINGLEMLAGNTAAIGNACPFEAFSWNCDDSDGLSLATHVSQNDLVIVTINNSVAAGNPIVIQGGILIMPG